MSDASQFGNARQQRPLRPEEKDLLQRLLPESLLPVPSETRVIDMEDGGMGSVRFAYSEQRRFGSEIARAEFVDDDEVLVSITINVDEQGELFEIDFWKVNFAPLVRYPRPQDLVVK